MYMSISSFWSASDCVCCSRLIQSPAHVART